MKKIKLKEVVIDQLPQVIEDLGGELYLQFLGREHPALFVQLITRLYPKQTLEMLAPILCVESMSLLEKAEAVMLDMLAGKMAPDTCQVVLQNIKVQSEIIQGVELDNRLKFLEEAIKNQR